MDTDRFAYQLVYQTKIEALYKPSLLREGFCIRMKKLLFIISVLLVVSCGSKKKPDFAAANAARDYYNLLLEGNSDAFVAHMEIADSIPESYREQLVANANMYMDQQQTEHRGIKKVDVLNCVNDSLQSTAQAFLMLCYGDSTVEEIVVPMVKRGGKRLMK